MEVLARIYLNQIVVMPLLWLLSTVEIHYPRTVRGVNPIFRFTHSP